MKSTAIICIISFNLIFCLGAKGQKILLDSILCHNKKYSLKSFNNEYYKCTFFAGKLNCINFEDSLLYYDVSKKNIRLRIADNEYVNVICSPKVFYISSQNIVFNIDSLIKLRIDNHISKIPNLETYTTIFSGRKITITFKSFHEVAIRFKSNKTDFVITAFSLTDNYSFDQIVALSNNGIDSLINIVHFNYKRRVPETLSYYDYNKGIGIDIFMKRNRIHSIFQTPDLPGSTEINARAMYFYNYWGKVRKKYRQHAKLCP